MVNDQIRFELIPEVGKNVTHLTTVTFDSRANWHNVSAARSVRLSNALRAGNQLENAPRPADRLTYPTPRER